MVKTTILTKVSYLDEFNEILRRTRSHLNIDFSSPIETSLNQKQLDLLSIGLTFFEIEQDFYARNYLKSISIPNSANKIEEIKKLLNIYSKFIFEFDLKWELVQFTKEFKEQKKEEVAKSNAVVLFSGGVDSVAGFLHSKKLYHSLKGVFVGHSGNTTQLVTKLSEINIFKNRIYYNNVFCGGGDFIQQTRGFMYLIFGAVFADLFNTNKVILSECGLTMYHPPFFPADEITRTTHPYMVEIVKRLAKIILDRDIEFVIPFQDMTKTEILASTLKIGLSDIDKIIFQTDSCRHTMYKGPKKDKKNHCGYCSGCIIKRISSLYLDLDFDDYRLDPITNPIGTKFPYMDKFQTLTEKYMEDLYRIFDFAKYTLLGEMPNFQRLRIEEVDKIDLFDRFAKDIIFGLAYIDKKGKLKNTYLKRQIKNLSDIGVITDKKIFDRKNEIVSLKFKPNFKFVI